MERCAEVESECIRYGNALGGHVKATGGSVGEIRKEQVLPRRFEIISEYQEKLRQVRTVQLIEFTWRYGAPFRPSVHRQLESAYIDYVTMSLSRTLTYIALQLYHTKLEQLITLTGRLSTLSNTLGLDFYPEDILDPTPAAGEDEYDSASHRDVTPERFSRLEKELVRGKAEVVGSSLSGHATALTC